MAPVIKFGISFQSADSKEFTVVCISDVNLDSGGNEFNKKLFNKVLDFMFIFLRKEFECIYFTSSDIQGWNEKGKQYLAEYKFIVTSPELKKILTNFNNQFYNHDSIKKFVQEIKMKTPYQFWSVKSLHDELKRCGISESEYIDIDDKDVLIKLINKVGKKSKASSKSEKSSKDVSQSAPAENTNKKSTNKNTEAVMKKDRFSKLTTVKSLVSFKKQNALECKLLKSMSIEEMQEAVRKAYLASQKVAKKTKVADEPVAKKKTSKKAKVADEPVAKKKTSKKAKVEDEPVADKKKTSKKTKVAGEKKAKSEKVSSGSNLPEDYVEERKRLRKIREQKALKNMDPEVKEAIKEFQKEFKGKKVDWNAKLKKAGLWINGMNFLKNYEKHQILEAKGKKQKRLLQEAADKIENVGKTLAKVSTLKNKMTS